MFKNLTYTGSGIALTDITFAGIQAALGELSTLSTVAGAALGLNTTRVARMVIRHEAYSAMNFASSFSVMFNPSRVSITSGCGWKARPHSGPGNWSTELTVSSGDRQPSTLSCDLLFDTTDEGVDLMTRLAESATGGLSMAFRQPTGTNVLEHTQLVSRLAQPAQELHRPPICQLWWGPYMLIQGVLTSCSQEFKHWKPDGTPVRASLSCSFTEYQQDSMFEFHSPDVEKTHTVRRGDTLPGLAAHYYNDAGKWWAIAQFNDLDDARFIESGRVLRIPALDR